MIIDKVKTNFSQANQDLFVLEILDYKKNGSYLEIGANEPISISNTYLLENDFGWNGFSIEIRQDLVEFFKSKRKNKCICADATTANYKEILDQNFNEKRIDYLSVDIEPPYNTYMALSKIPLDEYRFNVITFEHDLYTSGTEYKFKARQLLEYYGYKLIVENVKNSGNPFEDWYIDPSFIKEEKYSNFLFNNMEYSDIISVGRI